MAHLGFPPEFPPFKLLPLIEEVTSLLKGRNETVSVAETVCYIFVYSSIAAIMLEMKQAPSSMNIGDRFNLSLCCLRHAHGAANCLMQNRTECLYLYIADTDIRLLVLNMLDRYGLIGHIT